MPYDYGKLAQGPDQLQNVGHTNQLGGPDQLGNHATSSGLQDMGPAPSSAPQSNSVPPMHMRTPSLTPLLAGAAAAGLSAASAAGASSRPSSSDSSTVPSLAPVPPGAGQPFNPTQNYPPNLQNYMQTQGYSPPPPQPNTNLSHTMSVGSTAPSTYSNSSWGAGSSSPGYNPGPANIIPVMAAAGLAGGSGAAGVNRMTTHQAQGPSTADPSNQYPPHPHNASLHHTASYQPSMSSQSNYSDPFNRTGSPVSVQENRILHIANADPGFGSPDNSFSYGNNAEASSSAAAGPGPSSAAAGSSSAATQVDGKGRPLNTSGEKAPLVHLDGGAYQAPEPGTTNPPPGPAPPAYSA